MNTAPDTKRFIFLFAAILFAWNISVLSSSFADDTVSAKVKAIVAELRKAEEKVKNATDSYPIHEKIELASWQLMLGEYTSSYPAMSLSTTSINAFMSGKELLGEIEEKIKSEPSLEELISSSPIVALRLDTARIRLGLFEQKLAASRQKELKRLSALRILNNNYLQLNHDLTDWMTSQTVGDSRRSLAAAQNCLKNLNQIFLNVDGGKDLHLFSDEPDVGGNKPFSNSDSMPVPFSNDGISLFKSIQALVYLQMAQSQPDAQSKYLPLAREWAGAAMDENAQLDGIPKGADPENLLAQLVVALCDDTEGSQASLDADPLKRTSGREMLVKSKQGLEQFKSKLEAKGFDPASTLQLIANQKFNHLEKPDGLLEMASRSISEGQPSRAREHFLEAARRHPTQEIVSEFISTGLRHGIPIAQLQQEFKEFENIAILDPAHPEMVLLSAQLTNSKAAAAMQLGDDPGEVLAELMSSRQAMERWLDDRELDKTVAAGVQANAALAFVYCWALGDPNGDGTAVEKNDVTKMYRLARDAEYHFSHLLETADQNPQPDAGSADEQREALVASRIALGHLAALGLDDWRDESRIFFTAAANEAGQVGQSSHLLKMLSTPLLRHVLEKSEGGNLKLANDERQKRQMMTMGIEAMYASRFGEKEQASRQMAKAVAAGEAIMQGGGKQLDMDELSVGADGFDSNVNLLDTVKAFQVLSELDAGRTTDAFGHVMQLAGHPDSNPEIAAGCFDATVANIQSPLVGYAFGKVIEQAAAEIPLKEELAQRLVLLEYAKQTYRRTQTLLASDRLTAKYPHLHGLLNQHLAMLDSPADYIDTVREAISANQKNKAQTIVSDALSRHPKNGPLWRDYFQLQIDLAQDSPQQAAATLQEVLAELQIVSTIGVLSQFELDYTTGVVHGLLNELDDALDHYQSAIEVAENTPDRILATAAKTDIRVRQIQASEALEPAEDSTN